MPWFIRIASFIKHYGMDVFTNPIYATKDNVIPFRLFFLFEMATRSTNAQERMTQTNAVAIAIGMALKGDDPGIRRAIKNTQNDALGQFDLTKR